MFDDLIKKAEERYLMTVFTVARAPLGVTVPTAASLASVGKTLTEFDADVALAREEVDRLRNKGELDTALSMSLPKQMSDARRNELMGQLARQARIQIRPSATSDRILNFHRGGTALSSATASNQITLSADQQRLLESLTCVPMVGELESVKSMIHDVASKVATNEAAQYQNSDKYPPASFELPDAEMGVLRAALGVPDGEERSAQSMIEELLKKLTRQKELMGNLVH